VPLDGAVDPRKGTVDLRNHTDVVLGRYDVGQGWPETARVLGMHSDGCAGSRATQVGGRSPWFKTVEAFSGRPCDQIDLDTLSTELMAVVDQTMELTRVSL